MTNLKKTLAVVLAFAMIFSMGVSVFASYSDVEEGTTVGEAVGILSNLNILTGFEDGTFKPEETVTRAQMAAIICRTLGYEAQAQSSAGSTMFNDVAADHWAAGYINVAQSLGIINGYGDGNFGPEDKVLYEQAVKMIVCALNYELVAQNKGGYPTGYLSVASSEGITKAANGKVGDAAKRSTVAVLVYNALEVQLLDQSSWTTDGSDEYAKGDDTILSKYLEVEKWEGIVTSDPYITYAKDGYSEDTTPEITIDGFKKYYVNGKEVKSTDYENGEEEVTADCSLVDVEGLFGKKVIAYVGADEDEETGNIMLYAINEKTNSNTVTTVTGAQLVDDEDKEYEIDNQISYRKTGSSKVYDLDINEETEFYVNYDKMEQKDVVASHKELRENDKKEEVDQKWLTTADIAEIINDGSDTFGGVIEFISNDNSDDIEFVMIKAYADESVIEEVTFEDGIYSFTLYNKGNLDEIDTEDEDSYCEVYKDGVKTDVTALAANDTVSIVSVHNDVTLFYVSSATVTGAVDSYDDETVTIGGVDYELSTFSKKIPSALKDEEGTFFLNVDGEIAHNETDTTAAGNYGMVLAVEHETGITDGYVMQVAMFDGSVVEYDLSNKAKFYDKDNKQVGGDDADTATEIAKIISGDSALIATLLAENAYKSIFKFTFKNDEITKIKALQGDSIKYLDANTKKYDAEAMSYGSIEMDEETVVFAVENDYAEYAKELEALQDSDDYKEATENEQKAMVKALKEELTVEDDAVTVGSVSEFFTDEDDALTIVGLDAEDGGVYKVVVGFDIKASVPEDSAAVIITNTKTVTYDDDEATQITGIQAGEEVSYIIYDEDADYTNADPADLNKGDVILVAAANSENVVSDFKLLYSADKEGLGTVSKAAKDGDASDDIYNAAGNLVKVLTKESNSKFFLDVEVKNSGSEIFAELEEYVIGKDDDDKDIKVKASSMTIKSSANYTLVDYTESTKNPDIEKKSSNAVFSTSSKYDTVVFVRVYDDVITEVVAYRYLAK